MTELNAAVRDIPMPDRMKKLPISDKGFPIPWFVHRDENGVPNFTAIHPGRIFRAHTEHRCWLCGGKLGSYKCFTVGPMCIVNRVSAEPPSHLECAQYATRACPFLVNPRAKRNAKALPDQHVPAPGEMIERNPGVTALYVTKRYSVFKVENGSLFNIGDPIKVEWWCQGRSATTEEINTSIETGLPALYDACERGDDPKQSRVSLEKYIARARTLLPA